jgi:serine protease Do
VYDIVIDADGRDIASNEDLIRYISARQPGSVVRVQLSRDGRRMTVPIRLVERPRESGRDDDALAGSREQPTPAPPDMPLGLSVRDLDRGFAGRLEIPESVSGVVVSRVDPTGAAFSAQMRRNLIITEINRRPVRSVADYSRIVSAARPGDVLAIYYYDPTVAQRRLVTVTVEP